MFDDDEISLLVSIADAEETSSKTRLNEAFRHRCWPTICELKFGTT